MFLLAAALWAMTTSSSAEKAPRCTMGRDWMRPPNPPVLVLRASRDSVLDGFYASATYGPRRLNPAPGEFNRPVYGQVFEVLTIEGPDAPALANTKRAVVIWWSISASCTQYFPGQAVRVPTGDAFILARARPTAEWINGMPTFDVQHEDWVYIPTEYRAATPNQSAMTMAEYRNFFPRIPTSGPGVEQTPNAWQQLLSWAEANPELARKFPAAKTLCIMRVFEKQDRAC